MLTRLIISSGVTCSYIFKKGFTQRDQDPKRILIIITIFEPLATISNPLPKTGIVSRGSGGAHQTRGISVFSPIWHF